MSSDYPNISKEVPAWRKLRRLNGFAEPVGPIYDQEYLTGLAQFVRAVVREMYPADERDSDALPKFIRKVVREMDRETVLSCYTHTDPPAQPPDPDLAERLARDAAEVIIGNRYDMETLINILRPYFRRAAEASQGGE